MGVWWVGRGTMLMPTLISMSQCRFQKSGRGNEIFLATKFGYVTEFSVDGRAE